MGSNSSSALASKRRIVEQPLLERCEHRHVVTLRERRLVDCAAELLQCGYDRLGFLTMDQYYHRRMASVELLA
jgi:hypothetical protein